MKEYELLYEYYNTCSNMPTKTFSEVQTDNLDEYVKQYTPQNAKCIRTDMPNGDIVFEVMSSGIRKRFAFSEV